jgi:hypothetical protein
MPPDRRSFVVRRAPITPPFRQNRKLSITGSTANATKEGAGAGAVPNESPPDQNELIQKAITANQATREAQQQLHALEPLHHAATGAQRSVLDRRIKRALVRLNKALDQFVALEEQMTTETRAALHDMLDAAK